MLIPRLRSVLMYCACALVLVLNGGQRAQAVRCLHQLSSCSCETDYGLVDFSKLSSGSIVIPRFQSQMDEAPFWTIEYNPCGPFYCTDRAVAASCVTNWYDPLGVTIGSAPTANFVDTFDYYTTTIRYTAIGVNGTNFLTDVTFECRPGVEGVFYVKHVFAQKYFSLAVETKHACLPGTPPPAPPLNFTISHSSTTTQSTTTPRHHDNDDHVGGPGVGTIILLVAATLLLVYFVGGILINWATRGSNPDASLVPHATLWVELWTNIVAGNLYVFWLARGCPGGGSPGYGEGFEPIPEPGPGPRAAPVRVVGTGPQLGPAAGGQDSSNKYGTSSDYQPV